jgi:hypothetical protein
MILRRMAVLTIAGAAMFGSDGVALAATATKVAQDARAIQSASVSPWPFVVDKWLRRCELA